MIVISLLPYRHVKFISVCLLLAFCSDSLFQDGLELMILLNLPPECWITETIPPYLPLFIFDDPRPFEKCPLFLKSVFSPSPFFLLSLLPFPSLPLFFPLRDSISLYVGHTSLVLSMYLGQAGLELTTLLLHLSNCPYHEYMLLY